MGTFCWPLSVSGEEEEEEEEEPCWSDGSLVSETRGEC